MKASNHSVIAPENCSVLFREIDLLPHFRVCSFISDPVLSVKFCWRAVPDV